MNLNSSNFNSGVNITPENDRVQKIQIKKTKDILVILPFFLQEGHQKSSHSSTSSENCRVVQHIALRTFQKDCHRTVPEVQTFFEDEKVRFQV